MNRYQLSTLVKWAETLHTRKRLQKVVYLLQAAGCDLNAEYGLHHYGPYSYDVASLTDEMVQAGLLCEEETPNPMGGTSYAYRLSEGAERQLAKLERDANHQQRLGALGEYRPLALQLLQEPDLRKLEYAATIAYFYAKHPHEGWVKARDAAGSFKRQGSDSEIMQDAARIAREVVNAENRG